VSVDRTSRIIKDYDSQGCHRTRTNTDHLSAGWLIDKINGIGISADKESSPLNHVNPISSYLKINNSVIKGLPMFDCLYTDENITNARSIDVGIILGRESPHIANLSSNLIVLQGTNSLIHIQEDR
jgi:hypothetical protein